MQGMRISAAARAAGVSVETVRYYERAGLLAQPPRPLSGYRGYPADAVERIQFIKRSQRLGFALSEIRDLLSLQLDSHLTCEDVTRRAGVKVTEIEERIATLASMKEGLLTLMARCDTECSSVCTVLIDIDPPARSESVVGRARAVAAPAAVPPSATGV
jgi:MerR family transcriptional regulator, copper efflux regulator